MKRYAYKLITFTLLFFAVGACTLEKEALSDDDPNSGSSKNSLTEIIATNISYPDGGRGSIATVKVLIMTDFNEKEIASTKYENDGFRLSLPKTVPDEYLQNGTLPESFSGTISDKKLKTAIMGIVAYNTYGEQIGEFVCCSLKDLNDDSYSSYYAMGYLFANGDCTAKGDWKWKGVGGDYVTEIDVSYKKGWNILYLKTSKRGYYKYTSLNTTNKPTEKFYWHYHEY